MVHFIGRDKPWMQGREALDQAGGVYRELLGIWWSTYDRHYRMTVSNFSQDCLQKLMSPTQSSPTGGKPLRTVQQYVKGEQTQSEKAGTSSLSAVRKSSDAQVPHTTAEVPFTETTHEGESLQQGLLLPTSTQEQRRMSAPHNEWDATRYVISKLSIGEKRD